MVSGVKEFSDRERVGSFRVDDKEFTIHKASGEKCPRCWRFISKDEGGLCNRCERVSKWLISANLSLFQ